MWQQTSNTTTSDERWGRGLGSWGMLAVMSLALVACGSGEQEGGPGDMPPPPVTVETVAKTSVDVTEDYAGRVRGAREVNVLARVEGVLQERLYTEGRLVEKGDTLFRIDPEPFEVALEAAEAEKQTAQADYNQADREWQRVSRLYDQNAVSERERDTARSALELSRAALAVAQAGVRRAELELSYTNVAAPVSGVTSLETQSEGNLVDRGTELTRITQLDPVHVRFALPEDDAAVQRQARQAMQEGDEDKDVHRRQAVLIQADGSEYEQPGDVDFTASTLDYATGTVTARAVFPNAEQVIIPGQFVRIRVVLETLDEVVVVPERAISDGPEGLRVFIVDDEDKAQSRTVKTRRAVGGKMIIEEGLEPGDRVVVNGMAAIQQDGMPVNVFDSETDRQEAQEEAQAEAEEGQGGAG